MAFDLSKIEGFEWDNGNLEHIEKHDVGYKECEEVFFNKPLIVNKDKEHSQIEQRWEVLGRINKGRLLFIAFTIRKSKIRVISARDQNKKERKIYQNGGEKNEKTKINT